MPKRPRRKTNNVKATCCPDKPHVARGLCSAHYEARHSDEHRARKRLTRLNSAFNKRYGLTLDQVNAAKYEQQFRCAICQSLIGKDLVVDHDHETGFVRGMLCRACNTGLGGFKDSPALLECAIWYLGYSARRQKKGAA